MAKAVFCIATTEAQATTIVDQLKTAGFSHNDISVLFPDKTGTRDFAHEQHTKAREAQPGAEGGAFFSSQRDRSWPLAGRRRARRWVA